MTTTIQTGTAADLARAWSSTDALFDLLSPDALYERPVPERHRLIFYLGHVEAFDWNLLCRRTLDEPSFHPAFDKLFEFGIDPPEGSQPQDRLGDWPSAAEIQRYRDCIRAKLLSRAGELPDQLLQVAIEHRLMHAETLAYLFHNLDYRFKMAPSRAAAVESPVSALPAGVVEIPAGEATLGQRAESFGWDNEFACHRVDVPAFRIARHKVTNGQFLEFVREGAAPSFFWTHRDGRWFFRGMFGEIPLPLDWPVYVTHEQAADYARWRRARLPTEAEYHRSAFSIPAGGERPYAWGDSAPDPTRGNFGFSHWDPVPVTAHPRGDSAFGVSQLCGNGWEWTSTVFAPFPGFKPFPFYPGYSRDFFDGSHYVLKGASPRTAHCFLRRPFRNWFRPRYPYLYATFRTVES